MRIGIDLGGTKIEIIALDRGGQEKLRKRVPTPKDSYRRTLEAIKNLIEEAEKELGLPISKVGIGTPGALSPVTGLIKNSNSTCLNGNPLDKDLEKLLKREVRLANDANCFALSEAVDGAADDGEVVFGVIIGTGCGGGVVFRKSVWTGPQAIAGEWGHNPLPWPNEDELNGPRCPCGKVGCIEAFLSGPGFEKDYLKASGQSLSAIEIEKKARSNDRVALAVMSRYFDRMARALATVVNILDPNVIVVGGGMSKVSSIYTEVPRLLERYVFTDHLKVNLRRAKHGDSSGVRGAAWLFDHS